jgi:hypothetical protein
VQICEFMVMEEVEEANRAAVESCKKLVAVLSRSGDPFRPVPVAAETDEAVARFGKVAAVLSDRLGHARARITGKRSAPPIDASCLMDHPSMAAPFQTHSNCLLVSTPALPPTTRSVPLMSSRETAAPCASVTLTSAKFDRDTFLGTPLLDLNSRSVPSLNAMMAVQKNNSSSKVVAAPVANPCTATTHIQFQPQQQQAKAQKNFLFDQTPSAGQFHIEVPVPRGGGGCAKEVISFSFDNSVCTSSAATTSFFTSIGSQLISMSDAATSSAATGKKACGKRRGEDGGVKCRCPKKKSLPFGSWHRELLSLQRCSDVDVATSLQEAEGQAGGEGAGDQRQERRHTGG